MFGLKKRTSRKTTFDENSAQNRGSSCCQVVNACARKLPRIAHPLSNRVFFSSRLILSALRASIFVAESLHLRRCLFLPSSWNVGIEVEVHDPGKFGVSLVDLC